MKSYRILLVALLTCALSAVAHATLSIPSNKPTEASSARAAKIQAMASQIKNEPRHMTVAGVTYPLYDGPLWTPGSLFTKIQMQEFMKLVTFRRAQPLKAAALAAQLAPDFKTIEDYTAFYDDIAHIYEKPMAADNSDVVFGAQRLAIKGFTMRLVGTDEYLGESDDDYEDLSLSDDDLSQLCGPGLTVATIREEKALFVSEFDDIAQFNDHKAKHRKYVPNVIGFFCFNKAKQQLLPIEIRLIDTGLTYTPFDSEDEWTLAKMALEASELNHMEMQHMAETHAMSIPIRVEAYRTMASEHPVSALLLHHVFADFALEMLSATLLLNTSTEVDKTFGFGADGCIRFLDHQIKHDTVRVSMHNDFPRDVARRGLDHIPTHKYVQYGRLYYAAFDAFVTKYLDAFYVDDDALVNDSEVQHWAANCARVPHLRAFPSKFTTKTELRRVLTHIIFQSTFKHHAMNGASTWQAVAIPYSILALWSPLPTRKLADAERLDLTKYTIPKQFVADQIRSPALFYRAMPISETLLDAYRNASFSSEAALYPAIREFDTTIRQIDASLAQRENNLTQSWPAHLYRPGMLSYYTWI